MRSFPIVDVVFFDTGLDRVLVEDHNRIGEAFSLPRLNRYAARQQQGGGEHYKKASSHKEKLLVEQRGQFIPIALLMRCFKAIVPVAHDAFFIDKNRRRHGFDLIECRQAFLRIDDDGEGHLIV